MEQKRSTRLVLKTSDLTADSTTNIGSCDQYKTTFTWFNINLRALLGDLYYQYDYFNMTLTNLNCSAMGSTVATGNHDDRILTVKISGLPFINQSYNQPTGNNGIFTTFAAYNLPTAHYGSNDQFYNNGSNVMTFRKDQDQCNITISFFRVVDDVPPALTSTFPNFIFIFAITGIDKADNPDRINYLMKIN
jgi:hypothetical protein